MCELKPSGSHRGFSLVELIAVILLLAIVSVVVLPRFSDPQSFRDLLLKDSLVSMARFAQQTALSRHNQSTRLELSRPSDWLFRVSVDTDGDDVFELTVKQLVLEAGNSTLDLVTPASIDVAASSLTIRYDNLGNVTQYNATALTANNLYFLATDRPFCISLAGYAYQPTNQADCENN